MKTATTTKKQTITRWFAETKQLEEEERCAGQVGSLLPSWPLGAFSQGQRRLRATGEKGPVIHPLKCQGHQPSNDREPQCMTPAPGGCNCLRGLQLLQGDTCTSRSSTFTLWCLYVCACTCVCVCVCVHTRKYAVTPGPAYLF